MPEGESTPRVNKAITIDLETLSALHPDMLKELKEKHGLEIQVRSSQPGIDRLTSSIPVKKAGAAEYDRGFDRTNPGYDKYYDRDKAMINPGELVSQPAKLVDVARTPIDVKPLVDELIRRASGQR